MVELRQAGNGDLYLALIGDHPVDGSLDVYYLEAYRGIPQIEAAAPNGEN